MGLNDVLKRWAGKVVNQPRGKPQKAKALAWGIEGTHSATKCISQEMRGVMLPKPSGK